MASGDDARRVRELEQMCTLMEKVVLIQEKRIWSLQMLKRLERGELMTGSSDPERTRTRQILEGNLRVSHEILDGLAKDLGYEASVFKLLDPEFVYGAPGTEVPPALTEQLERIDAIERERGCSHVASMFRELKTRHDEFLGEVQGEVSRDVEIHRCFQAMASTPPGVERRTRPRDGSERT